MTRAQLEGTPYGKEIDRRLRIGMVVEEDEVPIFAEQEVQPLFPCR
jgi:hypothetical protein